MIELKSDEYEVTLAPELGGAVTRMTWRGRDVMRPSPADVDDILQTASFPLAPFANRIAHGRFAFGGRNVQLALNFGDHPHALHGHAWQRRWRVTEAQGDRARLAFAYKRDDWPWSYSCTQDVALDANGSVMFTLSIRNDADMAMPASLGFHPYFPRTRETVLHAHVNGMWRIDETILPTDFDPVPIIDLPHGARLEGSPFVDHCFTGWSRTATIRQPTYGVRMTASDDMRFFHVYLPVGESFFCAEPVTAMPDAPNRQDVQGNGLKVLRPGETWSVWMRNSGGV